jgi:hypothetical protein
MRGLLAAGEAAGAENGGGLFERDFQAVEELSHGGFVGGEEARGLGLEFEVQIADGPADAGGGRRCDVEGDFDNGLGVLLDRVAGGGGLEKRVAMLEWRIELKTKFGAIVGGAAPQALGEREALDAKGNFWERRICRRERAGNELHERSETVGPAQNKK